MAVMASWNGKTWGVSSQRIAALNGVSSSVELDTENSDDKAGSPATKTKALKLQSMSFDFDLASAVGGDARGEFESWTSLVGQYAPFFLAGRRFGPANLQLTGVSLSDTTLDNLGRILKGKITIIGCPKLDDVDYSEKLTQIIAQNDIKSITVVRMEVPCCGGIEQAVKNALAASGKMIPWQVDIISTDGRILE